MRKKLKTSSSNSQKTVGASSLTLRKASKKKSSLKKKKDLQVTTKQLKTSTVKPVKDGSSTINPYSLEGHKNLKGAKRYGAYILNAHTTGKSEPLVRSPIWNNTDFDLNIEPLVVGKSYDVEIDFGYGKKLKFRDSLVMVDEKEYPLIEYIWCLLSVKCYRADMVARKV
jgi:hypothetical protein